MELTIKTFVEKVQQAPYKLDDTCTLLEVDKGDFEEFDSQVIINLKGFDMKDWKRQCRERNDFIEFTAENTAKFSMPTWWGLKAYKLVTLEG